MKWILETLIKLASAMQLIPLVLIWVGVQELWDWQRAAIVIGSLMWVDLYIPDRDKK